MLDADQLEAHALAELKRFEGLSRGTMRSAVEIGIILLALREKRGYGQWLPTLERLDMKGGTAKRFISFGENRDFLLATLDQAPDLTPLGADRLIAQRRLARLPDDMPVVTEAGEGRTKEKTASCRAEQHAIRVLGQLKGALAELEELVYCDPQSPEAVAGIQHVQLKARTPGTTRREHCGQHRRASIARRASRRKRCGSSARQNE